MPIGEIKRGAKRLLREHRRLAVISLFVFLLVYFVSVLLELSVRTIFRVPSIDFSAPLEFNRAIAISLAITAGVFVLQLIIIAPLTLGISRCLYKAAGSEPTGCGEIFEYYSSLSLLWRAVRFRFSIFMRQLFYIILLFVPAGLCAFFLNADIQYTLGLNLTGGAAMSIRFLGAALAICGIFLSVIVFLRYLLTEYVIAADHSVKIPKGIKVGVAMIKGYRTIFLALFMSMFGWFVLCLFILPLVFVLPYLWACMAVYSRRIIEHCRANESTTMPAKNVHHAHTVEFGQMTLSDM